MGGSLSHEVTGVDEAKAAFAALGTPTEAVESASRESGGAFEADARALIPVRRGVTAASLKVTPTSDGWTVTAGSPTVQTAYVMHATALGKANGEMTFSVPSHTRRGRRVSAYVAVRRIANNPFLKTVFDRRKAQVPTDFVAALKNMLSRFPSGRG